MGTLAPPPAIVHDEIRDPCQPTPCGLYSQCRNSNGIPSCSCIQNYFGAAPNCRPECTINPECQSNKACIREKCVDPCPGSCGINAQCAVINHTPICTCPAEYIGDPFTNCQPAPPPRKANKLSKWMSHHSSQIYYFIIFLAREPVFDDPCNPSPCGPNANCLDGICSCLPEYHGDPYSLCRPECVLNSDCARDRACLRSKCVNPCPGTCASNAICEVLNHIPMCTCPNGMEGNAFTQCRPLQSTRNYLSSAHLF